MLTETALWKTELSSLKTNLLSVSIADDESVLFSLERSLYYSALVVRKLLENRRLTDKLAMHELSVSVFRARPENVSEVIRTATRYFEIGKDFDENPENKIRLKLSKICSEIIHSFALIWALDESGSIDSVIVSSHINQNDRAILLSLSDWETILQSIVDDEVLEVDVRRDSKTGKVVRRNL
ncbi:hypothetical protein [Ponticaulis profundi]|uniref:HEPN domain-containing protein n=1 Tax=Ponticaulis profundi TaxID=2665222 RepID=A0ABW1S5N4_9PROT